MAMPSTKPCRVQSTTCRSFDFHTPGRMSGKGRFETLLGCRYGLHRYFAQVAPADLDVPVLGSTGADAASVRRYSHTLTPGAGDGTPRASLGSRALGQEPMEDLPPDPGPSPLFAERCARSFVDELP